MQCQGGWLPAVENRLDNVRRQDSQPQDFLNVPFRIAARLSDGCCRGKLPRFKFRSPSMAERDRFNKSVITVIGACKAAGSGSNSVKVKNERPSAQNSQYILSLLLNCKEVFAG